MSVNDALVDEIVHGLADPAFSTIDEALRAPADGGVPVRPGYYAWWCDVTNYPGIVPGTSHPTEAVGLLYVGIAPGTARSCSDLRARLSGNHISGNAAASTFRFGLSAALWRERGWRPCLSPGGKALLPGNENKCLSCWQRSYLRLRWHEVPEPYRYDLETKVIRRMEPPMNRAHNGEHRFYPEMGRLRAEFRAAAQATGPCRDLPPASPTSRERPC